MQDFRELRVWQAAHEFVLQVYRVSRAFPSDERFGLTSQLRRSSASIPANIAEGCGRGTDRDFRRFIQMAMGSASESEYHLILAKDLGFVNEQDYEELLDRVQRIKRMSTALIRRLKSSDSNDQNP